MNPLKRLTEIGIALSKEKNVSKLFEMIVDFGMEFTRSDGGTLYIVSDDGRYLNFVIVKNKSLSVNLTDGSYLKDWPPVPLYFDDGSPNLSNVCSFCALKAETVNIEDAYETTLFNFQGTRAFDSMRNYRSKSMLVVPMKNHEDEVIGVLQLINAIDESGNIISFSKDSEEIAECLASQAAVALTNRILINELERLFESAIQVIAKAIDEKSPYTADHSRRVAEISLLLAQRVGEARYGPFKDINFNEDELRALRIAAFLHDVGKIKVPEHVMDKATKLQCIFDRIDLIKLRYEFLRKFYPSREESEEIEEELKFLEGVNMGLKPLADEDLRKLQKIAQRKVSIGSTDFQLITEEELKNLSIRAGTLTDEERAIIQSHAESTYRMLSQLPFPKKLKGVPVFASSHHEKLNGKGYPKGLSGDQLPIQARILAIADVFEALTARNRPYKKPNTLSQALSIMRDMVERGELDKDLFELFVESGIPKEYAKSELLPEQVDI